MRSLLAEGEKLKEMILIYQKEKKTEYDSKKKTREEDEDHHFRSFSVCGFYFFSPQDPVVLCQKLKDRGRQEEDEGKESNFSLSCVVCEVLMSV